MTNFHVGQKVCCIDDANWIGGYGDEKSPVKGGIYTVRAIVWSRHFQHQLVLLTEIVNEPRLYMGHFGPTEGGFFAHRFRPVRETSIDCFKAILETVRENA